MADIFLFRYRFLGIHSRVEGNPNIRAPLFWDEKEGCVETRYLSNS